MVIKFNFREDMGSELITVEWARL